MNICIFMMFFQILFDYWISISLMIKKQPFIIFLPKKPRIYSYFSEFASEALHIVVFENFVKSLAYRNWNLHLVFASISKSLTTRQQLCITNCTRNSLLNLSLLFLTNAPKCALIFLFWAPYYLPYVRHYNPWFVYFLPIFENHFFIFKEFFFHKTLSLCMVNIQECFLIKSGL